MVRGSEAADASRSLVIDQKWKLQQIEREHSRLYALQKQAQASGRKRDYFASFAGPPHYDGISRKAEEAAPAKKHREESSARPSTISHQSSSSSQRTQSSSVFARLTRDERDDRPDMPPPATVPSSRSHARDGSDLDRRLSQPVHEPPVSRAPPGPSALGLDLDRRLAQEPSTARTPLLPAPTQAPHAAHEYGQPSREPQVVRVPSTSTAARSEYVPTAPEYSTAEPRENPYSQQAQSASQAYAQPSSAPAQDLRSTLAHEYTQSTRRPPGATPPQDLRTTLAQEYQQSGRDYPQPTQSFAYGSRQTPTGHPQEYPPTAPEYAQTSRRFSRPAHEQAAAVPPQHAQAPLDYPYPGPEFGQAPGGYPPGVRQPPAGMPPQRLPPGREFSHSSPEFALAQPGFPRGGPQQGYPPHAAQDYPPAPNQYGFPANGYGHEMAQAVSDPLFAGNAENELLVKYRIMLQYMARAKPVPLREIPRVWRDTFPSAIDFDIRHCGNYRDVEELFTSPAMHNVFFMKPSVFDNSHVVRSNNACKHYNEARSCNFPDCKWPHVCNICFGAHSAEECPWGRAYRDEVLSKYTAPAW